MKQYISQGRAMYEDENHGLFSKALAQWAIDNMKEKDVATKELKPIKQKSIEETKALLKEYSVQLPQAFIYTAWYLHNMAIADYKKSLTSDEQRAMFIEETICDPDGHPEAVLECFVAKMCLDGIPIHWEYML